MAITFLRKIPILSTLSPKDLKEVYRIAQTRKFEEGEAIFSKAESARHMFIVVEGRVKIFTHSSSKKSKTFAYLLPGDFFGEMGLVDGKTRSASAVAVVDSKLLMISKSDFKQLLLSDPDLTYYLLRTVSDRLRHANDEIESLLFRNVLGRVSKVLFDLSRTTGKKFRGGALLRDHYTHQELADLVGTTREPLTRALSTLRRADLIALRHGYYFIKDTNKLGAICLTA